MNDCSDIEVIECCFTPTDTSQSPVTLLKAIKFKAGEKVYYYSTSSAPDVAIDPTTFMGGGLITIGACAVNEHYVTDCWKNDTTEEVKKIVTVYDTNNKPFTLKTYLSEDYLSTEDVTGWTKTEPCECDCQ